MDRGPREGRHGQGSPLSNAGLSDWGGKTGDTLRIVLSTVERGWEILGRAIPPTAPFRGDLHVARDPRTRTAGSAAARTERSRRFKESESRHRTAKRSGYSIWAGEIFVHNHEYPQKHLPDPDFVKLVSGIPFRASSRERRPLRGAPANQVAEFWGIHPSTVRRIFDSVIGVIKLGNGKYRTILIPERVLELKHQELAA